MSVPKGTSVPEINIEEAFCEYLEKNYRGENNPISSKMLEVVFHVNGSEIRRIVNSLRCDSKPICSDATGYFYGETPLEIKATIAQLNSRVRKIAMAGDGLNKCLEEMEE